MKKLLAISILAAILMLAMASCALLPSEPETKEDVITVEDGYLVVNGVKTEYKVDTEDIVTVEDGYLVVNGVKTEYKVDKEDVIEFVDGYLVVNGVKTEYYFSECNHSWKTTTVAPTCREGGYDLKTCALCGKSVKVNETAKSEHTYATTYSSDTSYHWHACTACGDAKDKAEHQPTDDGMCAVCEQPVSATPGVIYDISADGTYAIVAAYTGTSKKVRIADTYEGLPVTTIYQEAFYDNDAITSVIIPDSVTIIGGSAFWGCNNLTSVVISDSVTTIGNYAFIDCSNLTSVVIGDSVTTIGDGAFSSCYKLTSVVIPDSVNTIGNWVFEGCRSLSSVVLGNGLTAISNWAFHNCSNLTSITIPDSLTTIGSDAFLGCTKLSSIIIPESVLNLGSDAFSSTAIQFNEYENCKYLGSGDNPYYYLINVLTPNLSSYTIHEDTKVIAGSAFGSCSRLTSIVIPDSVTTIGISAFRECSNLTSVVIPDSVTTIGNSAFESCFNLTSVVIPDSVTTIGDWAFLECYDLKDVYYTGSEAEWNAISNNFDFRYATIHYNYVPEN